MTAPTSRSLTFGLLCALAASLVTVLMLANGWAQWWLLVTAPAAAFICGAVFWRLLPERSSSRKFFRAGLAGALAGTVSHYFAWYFGYVVMNLCYWITGGCTSSLGEPPAGLLAAFAGAAAFTFFSLMIAGLATLLIGLGLGLAFAKRQMARESAE
jgi:hypothetical protein